jgi:hypothetical protein
LPGNHFHAHLNLLAEHIALMAEQITDSGHGAAPVAVSSSTRTSRDQCCRTPSNSARG